LGGHSLLAAQLFAEMEKQLGMRLPLALLFRGPTIDRLAALILVGEWLKEDWAMTRSTLVPIQLDGTRPPLFCVGVAQGEVLNYIMLAHYLGPDQPVFGLQARGLDGQEEPFATVEEMAAHYVPQIRSVQPEGPYYLAGYSAGGTVVFEIA